ncbi:glycosyltransferase family 39 protein [uncultured Methanobacterium sp.]|uniref:glycosyltransferase family 39 protein n=1 Tax=uncultured Methanobacterium sp. TaxID=176306 RepID=UPI0037487857
MSIPDSNQSSSKVPEKLKNPLFILTIITTAIAIILSAVQITRGVNYFDVFTYLNVALQYSGARCGGITVNSIPPLMPFLTSLIFRTGFISSSVIIILDAIIFIFGVIGLYLLLKQRFNEIQSFTGCLIYISLPLVFSWAASGSIDVPAISFSIWTMYFMVKGIEQDSKYLSLVIPMFVVAIFTRYTTAILIIPLIFYFTVGTSFLQNVKKHLKQVIIPLFIIIPFLIYAYLKITYLASLILLVTNSLIFGKSFGVGDAAYNTDNLYYLHNLLNYIAVGPINGSYYQILSPSQGSVSFLAIITAILVLCGLGIHIYTILKKKQEVMKGVDKGMILQLSILGILVIAAFFSFFRAPYLLTDIIVLFICLLIYYLLGDVDGKNLRMDLFFMLWFFTFFIMHSVTTLKVDRYLITIAPALAYFIFLGLSVLIEKYKYKIKKESLRSWGLYLIIGMIFLTSTAVTFAGHTPNTCLIKYIEPTAQWLEEYDPQYQDKIIFSDYSPAMSWSLNTTVFTGVLRDYSDENEFSSMLINSGAEYYIDVLSETKPTLNGFRVIKETDLIRVYQRIH